MELSLNELKIVERALNALLEKPLHPTHQREIRDLERRIQFAKLGMEV